MNILILGGSNAGMIGGWGRELERLAPGHVVVNRYLGAVGSLYAVLRLLVLDDDEVLPDLVIVECLLNDILLYSTAPLDLAMLAEGLDEIAAICADRGLRLLLVGLEPRSKRPPRPWSRAARVRRLYRRAVQRHGLAPMLCVPDVLGEPLGNNHYRDDNHLTQTVSERLARHLIDLVATTPPPVPRTGLRSGGAFSYIDAERASRTGAALPIRLRSAVFEGPFIELARPSTSAWPGHGRVAALLLRSHETAGQYRLSAGGRAWRKNAHSVMLTVLSPLMVMHYVERRLVARGDLVVAMPDDEGELERLPVDPTFQENRSRTPFREQLLHVNGVVFWRGASALSRLALALDEVWWARRQGGDEAAARGRHEPG